MKTWDKSASIAQLSENTKKQNHVKTKIIFFSSGTELCKSGMAKGSSGRVQDSKGRVQHPHKYA